MKSPFFSLCIIFVAIASSRCDISRAELPVTETRRPIWGDVSEPYYYQVRLEKNKFPFIKRCSEFEWPLNLPLEGGESRVVSQLRGIAHSNLVDKKEDDCADPDVRIVRGGIDESYTKIEACSKGGCPLTSILYFYTKQ